ncbi:Rieske 2Fe-2S domain-containing protein [Streptomyces sp. NPDC004787]|uniref:Rieske 2Fe-2S domain-containing protein n=1 Tax=Streptomyces sp. NPDC004787 TaxID=3154291 RepID=UPI0033B1574E
MGRRNRPQAADKILSPALPYPSGWFCAGFSDEVKSREVVTRAFMGDDIVIYRTGSGIINAIRPYCPHLGAHLGVGGTVDGELLVCPFHKWGFKSDGTCTRTPYGKPPRARLDLMQVREIAGIIWVWHSSDNSPPSWEIPDELNESHPMAHQELNLSGHPQDVMENLPDYQHLHHLHNIPIEPISEPERDGPLYSVSFRLHRPMPPLGAITQDATLRLVGLGGLRSEYRLFGDRLRAYTWVLPTPTAPWRISLRVATSAHVKISEKETRLTGLVARSLQSLIRRALNRYVVRDLHRDIPIWHHKKYLPHPKLNDGDGPIGPYRMWVRQFYPDATGTTEGSTTIRDVKASPRRSSP